MYFLLLPLFFFCTTTITAAENVTQPQQHRLKTIAQTTAGLGLTAVGALVSVKTIFSALNEDNYTDSNDTPSYFRFMFIPLQGIIGYYFMKKGIHLLRPTFTTKLTKSSVDTRSLLPTYFINIYNTMV